MSQPLIIQELAIIVAAKDLKPSILNPDFLKYSGIIPGEWEFARKPIFNNNVAQFSFKNGVSVIAEPNRVIFAEGITNKTTETVLIPQLINKYIQALPNLDFQAIGISPRGFVAFAEEDGGRKFINQRLLSPGAWQQEGNAPMRASLNLVYQLQRAPLSLNITEAFLRQEDKNIPIVMFNGSFSYQVNGNSAPEKLTFINQIVGNWFTDVTSFSNLINNKFLSNASGNIPVTETSVKVADANSEQSDLFTAARGA